MGTRQLQVRTDGSGKATDMEQVLAHHEWVHCQLLYGDVSRCVLSGAHEWWSEDSKLLRENSKSCEPG